MSKKLLRPGQPIVQMRRYIRNRGNPWMAEDDAVLVAAVARGETFLNISFLLGRSVSAITTRDYVLRQKAAGVVRVGRQKAGQEPAQPVEVDLPHA